MREFGRGAALIAAKSGPAHCMAGGKALFPALPAGREVLLTERAGLQSRRLENRKTYRRLCAVFGRLHWGVAKW